jgi:Integrase core domain
MMSASHKLLLLAHLANRSPSRTKARSPQSTGIYERFHKIIFQEFYQVAFRKKIYHALDELQADLDTWLHEYNESRPHSGKYCFGKAPMQTFVDSLPLAKERSLNQTVQTTADVTIGTSCYSLFRMSATVVRLAKMLSRLAHSLQLRYHYL